MPTSPDAAPPGRVVRLRLYEQVAEQITAWVERTGLTAGERLPPERELAERLGVSRATLSQALVALEVSGVVTVRHGDGTVLSESPGHRRLAEALRTRATRLPDVLDAYDALATRAAALAAERRTDTDLAHLDAALAQLAGEVADGHRGEVGDELFHEAVAAAAHSALLARLLGEVQDLLRPARVESLSQPGRPAEALASLRTVAAAVRAADPAAAASAMHAHVLLTSDAHLTDVAPSTFPIE
ncbi:FadR/GntR family transcriptional regulator [Intrasporangium sp. YIM S08009]|uniref:FadR/GntR family transcriptional regulator n=1 Tax=Intrasporangium zincisolvens TaxID=3080018 RepID=UPI002B0552AF|nr:FCD domain-containing protein [Intrasporangium sp. YIM S08009]